MCPDYYVMITTYVKERRAAPLKSRDRKEAVSFRSKIRQKFERKVTLLFILKLRLAYTQLVT